MPAVITHNFFGREMYDARFQTIGGTRDEADAFLLGNQGPDPLFYTLISPHIAEFHSLGQAMHKQKPAELLAAMKMAVDTLEGVQQKIGRAYALGFLCHYALDSTMHPFVYAQQFELCDAGEPGLSRADGSEVHGLIESELDEIVLFNKYGETIATFNPANETLNASIAVLQVVSKIYAYVASAVYDVVTPPNLFLMATLNFRIVQQAFYSPRGIKRQLIGRVERILRPYSFFKAMSHRANASTTSQFDNRHHNVWQNPFTTEKSTASFWDLHNAAKIKAAQLIEAFDSNFSLEATQNLTGRFNFSGSPTQAELVSVQDGCAAASEG